MLSALIRLLVTVFVVLPIKVFVVLPAKLLGPVIRLGVWVALLPVRLVLLPIRWLF
ncbi:MAG: hypothetical protein ABMA64_05040 [Myxococcota bacterium]|jgi:hypothetical protein